MKKTYRITREGKNVVIDLAAPYQLEFIKNALQIPGRFLDGLIFEMAMQYLTDSEKRSLISRATDLAQKHRINVTGYGIKSKGNTVRLDSNLEKLSRHPDKILKEDVFKGVLSAVLQKGNTGRRENQETGCRPANSKSAKLKMADFSEIAPDDRRPQLCKRKQ